jgi:hypothetical protein
MIKNLLYTVEIQSKFSIDFSHWMVYIAIFQINFKWLDSKILKYNSFTKLLIKHQIELNREILSFQRNKKGPRARITVM